MASETFISVDVEASGAVPGIHSLLSVGAADVDDPSACFEVELKPVTDECEPEAMAVIGRTLDDFRRVGREPAQAMAAFAGWAEARRVDGSRLVFVGLNAPYDWAFVAHAFRLHGVANPFGHTALDIKAYWMALRGCAWGETRSSMIDRVLAPERRPAHGALADALYQAEIFRRMRDGRRELLSLDGSRMGRSLGRRSCS